MNYQIISDLEALKSFIEWLPELSPSEQYYCCLFARSKYTKDLEGKNGIPHIKSDKAQLKRFTSTKDRLLYKIMQLECPIGSYVQGSRDTIIIPQEALALYITPNPRDLWKATKNSLKHFAEVVVTEGKTMNPQADAMSEIQRSKGQTSWVVFDIDSKEPETINTIKEYLDGSAYYKILETRGGIHLLVNPNNIHKTIEKEWYQYLSTFADKAGDIMIPVPGTYQGGFTPKFIV